MRITPTSTDFVNWSHCVPKGDLIFLKEENLHLAKQLPNPTLTKEQTKALGVHGPWSLNSRSWYGYALNQADYCISLPSGVLEQLDPPLRSALMEEQCRLQVPTVIDGLWMTSYRWSSLTPEEKIQFMHNWTIKNEIYIYESVDFGDLTNPVQAEIEKIGFSGRLNKFAPFSGPNCFATVAAAVQCNSDQNTTHKWMHWPELEKFLLSFKYVATASDTPKTGDVLIFSRNGEPIHAAYYLGDDFYFEKPGQDFYEPYRIARFKNWMNEWGNSTLIFWRKVP